MRGRICFLLIFLLLLSGQSRADTACVDFAQLAHSTVGITRYFGEAERNAQSDVVGIHDSPSAMKSRAIQLQSVALGCHLLITVAPKVFAALYSNTATRRSDMSASGSTVLRLCPFGQYRRPKSLH